MSRWRIAAPEAGDAADWIDLRRRLWPDAPRAEHEAVVAARNVASGGDRLVLLARDCAGAAAGLAEAAVRHDYVNGCDTSPVLFLEGVFVAEAVRGQGLGRALVDAVACWGGERALAEFASDAPLDNQPSRAFHRALGFVETERVLFFRRAIEAQA